MKTLLLILLLITASCSTVDPGADSLVVRAEQAETIARSTFDLILGIDNSNRPYFRTNAPAFHVFSEYLRAPVTIGTNTGPRSIQMILSLNSVKNQYKKSRGKEGDLLTAILTLQASVDQASAWMATVNTNSIPRR